MDILFLSMMLSRKMGTKLACIEYLVRKDQALEKLLTISTKDNRFWCCTESIPHHYHSLSLDKAILRVLSIKEKPCHINWSIQESTTSGWWTHVAITIQEGTSGSTQIRQKTSGTFHLKKWASMIWERASNSFKRRKRTRIKLLWLVTLKGQRSQLMLCLRIRNFTAKR